MFLPLVSSLFFLLPLASGFRLETLTIGAFNVKSFGQTKASDNVVMDQLEQIIRPYDVILIQEIRDKSQETLDILYKRLNSNPCKRYSYIRSDRLGQSPYYKLQYAFYYRSDKVDIIGSHLYSDPGDIFEREPFSVVLRVPVKNGVFNLALVGFHAKPSNAVEEINQLDEVYDEVKEKLFTDNVVILGSLNADCNYANDNDLSGTVFTSSNFDSLIDSNADTTTYTNTDCAYDRILVSGSELRSKDLATEVDTFDTTLGLSYEEALKVSGHYPVKLTVKL